MITARRLLGHYVSGAKLEGSVMLHAVESKGPVSIGPALCGARPGRLSTGWSEPVDDPVTCPRCLRKMKEVERGHPART
jgi:hypothetical protein